MLHQTVTTARRVPRPLIEVGFILPIAYVFGLVVARFGGVQALALMGGALIVISAFVEPRFLLFLLVPTIALSTELNIAGLPLRPEDFLIGLLGGAWMLRVLTRQTSLPLTPLTKPILFLLGVELVSTLLGALGGTTSLGITSPYSGTFFWLKGVEVFLLFFVIVDTLRSMRDIQIWTYLLALSGVALGLWGMINHLLGRFPYNFIPDPEGGATYSLLALALMGPILLSAAFVVLAPSVRQRLFWGAALIPLSYTFVFTFSRQAYIGLTAALVVLVYRLRRRAIPFVVLSAITIFVLAPASVGERASTIFDPVRSTSQDVALQGAVQNSVYGTRVRSWQRHLPEVLSQNPVTGLGSASKPPGFMDSQYLAIIYYNGLAGLIVFLWLLLRAGQLGWILYRNEYAPPPVRALGLGLTLTTIAMATASLGGLPFVAVRSRQMYWMLAAIAVAAHQCLHVTDEATIHADTRSHASSAVQYAVGVTTLSRQ